LSVREPVEQRATAETTADAELGPLLTVVVPVFNQEAAIASNVETIRGALEAGLGDDFELIVVSDGSIDRTAERVLDEHGGAIRVIHYDRNLGKGYAVKIGALEAHGRYVGYIDADLDLDPAWLPRFVAVAEERGLDFAIGSKRHPDSDVFYPRSRRAASWLYQQLVRVLFRLNVRDTQVGLKVFRREVAEQVLPLLLVKRYAFDLELLAVSRALGFSRIEEQPIRLDYRFTGSGVRSLAVLRALVDTAAIFYRLRILRYYQRRRLLAGAFGWTRPREYRPLVSVVTTDEAAVQELDYPNYEVLVVPDLSPASVRAGVARAGGEVIAFLGAGERPSGNWITATAPFLGRSEVSAVVAPRIAPHQGSRLGRAAAGVAESRLGGGALYFRSMPGNIRYVADFPTATIVVLKERYAALEREVPLDELAAELTAAGERVLYTPEAVSVAAPASLFRPHLRETLAYGRRRAEDLRRRGLRALRITTPLPILLVAFAATGPVALLVGGRLAAIWLVGAGIYLAALALSSIAAAFRFRSLTVGLLTLAGLAATHVAYAGGLAAGLLKR
jgi:glycosyltransferase involved in cell wall biosynthesis